MPKGWAKFCGKSGEKECGELCFFCSVVLLCLLVFVENFLPWHSSPCSGDFICVLLTATISKHLTWLLLKYCGTFALLSHKISWIHDATWVVPLPRNYVCSRKSQPKPLFATTGKGDNPIGGDEPASCVGVEPNLWLPSLKLTPIAPENRSHIPKWNKKKVFLPLPSMASGVKNHSLWIGV